MTSSSTYEKLDVSNGDLVDLINDIKFIQDNEELIHVWTAVKNQWDKNLDYALSKFYVGQDVECKFKDGNYYHEVVTKINKKTVGITVQEFNNKSYNVSPRWLKFYDN